MPIGFQPRKNLKGTGMVAPTMRRLLSASTTYTLGDMLTNDTANGYIDPATTSGEIAGVLTGFVDREGLPLDSHGAVAHGGTKSGKPGVFGSETVATASTNVSADLVYGLVVIDPDVLYKGDADGSLTAAMIGKYFVLADEQTVDQSSAGTFGQLILMGLDPDNEGDASMGLWKIANSQYVSHTES